MDWRALRWLNPRQPVRVLGSDGQSSVRLGVSGARVDYKGKVGRLAVELPEELVLRRTLSLPQLPDADLAAAVSLDARTSSPFPEGDLLWGFERRGPAAGGLLRAEVALSSKSQVSRYLSSLGLVDAAHEVWAGGAHPIVLVGGGARGGNRRWLKWMIGGLLVLGFCLLVTIAATPMLQTHFRLKDALLQHEKLVKAAMPQANLRTDLLKANEELEQVAGFVRAYPRPLVTLDELSRVLPDDAMLNTFEIKGDGVRISGIAVNAARLLELLAAQPGYIEVKAPSATSRVSGTNKEIFTIEFKVRRGEGAQ